MGIGFGRTLFVSALLLGMTAGAHVTAQDDLDKTFQEGVQLLRQGKDEEALEKFKAILKEDPANDEVYRLWSKTQEDVWIRMLLKRGEFEQVARALIEKATVERKRRMADEEMIQPLVKEALGKEFAARRAATIKLASDHGEFAVPSLIGALGDPDAEDAQIYAQQALVTMGPQATLPLLAALESDNAMLRRNIVITLRRLQDARACGALKLLAQKDEDPLVRNLAGEALGHLGARADAPERLFLALAEAYRTQDPKMVGHFEQGDTVWEWENGRLASRRVPALSYPFEISRQAAFRALAANPAYEAAKAEIVLSFLSERAAIDQQIAAGNADEELVARGNQLLAADVTIAAAGLNVIRQAANAALAQGDAPVCRAAFHALTLVESPDTMATGSPLQAALKHENAQVRGEAALALAKLDPQGRTDVSADVVALLAQTVNNRLVRLVQTIGLKDNARSVAEAAGRKSEISIAQASSGGEGLNRALTAPADLFVINYDLPDLSAIQVVNELRRSPATQGKKIVVVAKNPEIARNDMPEGKVDLILSEAEVAGDFSAKILEILADFEVNVGRTRAVQMAREAAATLARLDASKFGLVSVEASLIGAVDHEDNDVVKGVLQALASAGGPNSILPMIGAITSERPLEVRLAGADALGRVLARGGSLTVEQTEALFRLATGEAELSLRTAVASALGRSPLPETTRLELLRALRLPGAAPAEKAEKTEEVPDEM